jgi:hypothetical protein
MSTEKAITLLVHIPNEMHLMQYEMQIKICFLAEFQKFNHNSNKTD